ncbi:MAG: hypothetical protein SFX18_15110 [Pirellulales bacterium]|nr:hypothetical protein [Pirellulales bacterium]
MSQLARLAIGRLQCDADLRPLLWGMWDAIDREGLRLQTFQSRASYEPVDAATSITGLCPRHLDSWLMDPARVRQLFARAAKQSDLSILWGDLFAPGVECPVAGSRDALGPGKPGCLANYSAPERSRCSDLANWLQMPTLGVVHVARLQNCRWPARPANISGLILDGLADDRDFYYWKTQFEALWNVPVLGGMALCPPLREQVIRLQPGEEPPRELCRLLGHELLRHTSAQLLISLGQQALSWVLDDAGAAVVQIEPPASGYGLRPRIAVAYDDAFHCYFPDVLEECELAGAEVVDFSPLRDESLPADTDLVYIGCGHPYRFASQLGSNTCLQSALKEHVCQGKRIYAEGGGLAYLARELVLPDQTRLPMLGILPAIVELGPSLQRARGFEQALEAKSWLGEAGQFLRGYHNCNWSIRPLDRVQMLLKSPAGEPLMIARHHAIGSTVHLHFAAAGQLIQNLLRPCPASLDWAGR